MSPLTVTIFAGILTLAGTVFAAYWQASSALQQEEEKEQHDLIVKMVTGVNQQQGQLNLLFLANNSLIDERLAASILKYAATAARVPVIPASGSATSSAPSTFEAIRTDDDAINLVLTEEGGFINGPDGASNYGVSLAALSSYLGRTATVDDVKNLSRSAAIDFYKKVYGPPINGITAPLVRGAYFDLAALAGTRQAIQTLQTATGRVLGKDVTTDGVMGPESVNLINSIPDTDLLVETANCIELDSLEKRPGFLTFGKGWISRLRVFSPSTLRGVCPEIQSALSVGLDNPSPAPSSLGNK